MNESVPNNPAAAKPHRRRPRYSGKYPRQFHEKYKEHNPEHYGETIAKVVASGKTPAGSHRPIMVKEVLEILQPGPGQLIVDCTLGYGGHAAEILTRLQPGGRLIGLDADPLELTKTEVRLRALGFADNAFTPVRSNFAGLQRVQGSLGLQHVDGVLADLGVSSMQLDDPARGFSWKFEGPLDMRMNPRRGEPASSLLRKLSPEKLADLLTENADEAHATVLAPSLAGKAFASTTELARAIRSTLPRVGKEERDSAIRRVFQALRIAVNDEFSALDSLLREVPNVLKPGGRVAILTFHSGEDRRVKKAFAAGFRTGAYAEIAHEVVRPTADERYANPRSSSARLRWAIAA
ncbi:MAG TPA: 16S rRNA (cytosine(1402)-N(4))-methyltransferase RsmH [Candidatus Dormibacteraeota bacterium]|nr:16S rRNA (cytosine(1402)-N(4))-methyltransferase RsmH [Candidatus Dormibacteraeota bacterium]